MNDRLCIAAFALAASLSLAGCGGGGGSSGGGGVTPPAGGGGSTPQYGTISIAVSVPAAPASARRPLYVSPGTYGMTIVDASASGGATYHPTCVSSVCTLTFVASAGTHALTVTLDDISGNALSSGTTTTTVSPGQTDTLQLTFDPVVRSMHVGYVSSPPGAAADVAVKVVAVDADGYTIIGPGVFRDASGTPVVVTLIDADPSGHTSFAAGTIAGPDDAVTLHYDGAARTAVILKATATGSVVPGNGSFVSHGADATFAYQGTGQPTAATIGSDGNVWLTGWAPPGFDVVRLTPANAQTLYHRQPAGNLTISPHSIALGSDGNLWVPWSGGGGSNSVDRITTGGVATTFSDPSLNFPIGIAAGPDGNLWITNQLGQSVSRVTPAGAIVTHSLQIPSEPVFAQLSAFGSDGRLYFVNSASSEIDAYDIGTGAQSEYRLNGFTIYGNLVLGADGNIWFAASTPSASYLGSLTPSGTFATVPLNGASASSLERGPDGRIWFLDQFFGVRWLTANGEIGGFPVAAPLGGGLNLLTFTASGGFVVGNYNAQGIETLHAMPF